MEIGESLKNKKTRKLAYGINLVPKIFHARNPNEKTSFERWLSSHFNNLLYSVDLSYPCIFLSWPYKIPLRVKIMEEIRGVGGM
jgi:hypothetical protein